MPKIDVVLSPALLDFYTIEGKVVVVVDIFRASSSIVYGLENGALEIIPVSTIEDCLSYNRSEYLLAAEREGKVMEGFDFGNSPFSYIREKVEGKRIVLTTTNGTHAIELAKTAKMVLIGAFFNLKTICETLLELKKDVILLCSGWKNKFNIEDTLFAGAVVKGVTPYFTIAGDSAIAAQDLYELYQDNMSILLTKSSHSQRLINLGIEKDALFCLERNICQTVPVLVGKSLITHNILTP
jgi:2-phosphosulfolactate phosphatase